MRLDVGALVEHEVRAVDKTIARVERSLPAREHSRVAFGHVQSDEVSGAPCPHREAEDADREPGSKVVLVRVHVALVLDTR